MEQEVVFHAIRGSARARARAISILLSQGSVAQSIIDEYIISHEAALQCQHHRAVLSLSSRVEALESEQRWLPMPQRGDFGLRSQIWTQLRWRRQQRGSVRATVRITTLGLFLPHKSSHASFISHLLHSEVAPKSFLDEGAPSTRAITNTAAHATRPQLNVRFLLVSDTDAATHGHAHCHWHVLGFAPG
jgi:hypothetical protein